MQNDSTQPNQNLKGSFVEYRHNSMWEIWRQNVGMGEVEYMIKHVGEYYCTTSTLPKARAITDGMNEYYRNRKW